MRDDPIARQLRPTDFREVWVGFIHEGQERSDQRIERLRLQPVGLRKAIEEDIQPQVPRTLFLERGIIDEERRIEEFDEREEVPTDGVASASPSAAAGRASAG